MLLAVALWFCGSVADRVVGVGGTCTPARLELPPSPQIELGALTSANNLTRRQRCNPDSIRIDPVMEMQAYYQPYSLHYSEY